jgi:hypothetical protein
VLNVVSALNPPSPTVLIAFDRHPQNAKRHKHNDIRIGVKEEHRGAVTIMWLVAPTKLLHTSVRACAFG